MHIRPITHLTEAELRQQGEAAADNGEAIYEASIRAGLDSKSLLVFEQAYFKRRFELDAACA
jgi:hypothetical protein